MPQGQWSARRERQYTDIKESLLSRGRGEKLAEEIAARTVNKTRAQHGEAREASAVSLNDMSPSKRGGEHSHIGAQGRTRLLEEFSLEKLVSFYLELYRSLLPKVTGGPAS